MALLPLWAAPLVASLAGTLYSAILCTAWGADSPRKDACRHGAGVALTLACVALVDGRLPKSAAFFVATGLPQIIRREIADMIERDRSSKFATRNHDKT